MSANSSSSVILIGGGVIGLSIAWELARRGHRVTIVDRGPLARATSWAASGILPPANLATATDSIDQLRGLSHSMFPRWHQALLEITGIDSGLRRCGGWYLADSPGERAAMIGMTSFWEDLSIQCEPVTSRELAMREPVLRDWVMPLASGASNGGAAGREVAAWWLPDEYQIRCPRYLQALVAACRIAGVEVIENVPVLDIRSSDGVVQVLLPSTSLSADLAVLTSGVWSGQVSSSLNLQTSLVPIRGQILLLKTPTQPIRSVINVGNRYLVPREDGYTLVGSNEEEVGFQGGTTLEVLESLKQFAFGLCPHLQTAVVAKSWSGLRPMTFDGFPMIGRVPGTANVYVAAGHYRSGIHLSCGTAEVVANLIEERDNVVALDAFRVGKQQQSLNRYLSA